jgi:hypothetical protein
MFKYSLIILVLLLHYDVGIYHIALLLHGNMNMFNKLQSTAETKKKENEL